MEQIIVTHVDSTTLNLHSKEQGSGITKATQNVELLGNDTVDISVESSVKLVINIGDKINIIGRDYTLNIPAKERKLSETLFQYDLHFEGVQYDLLRASYSVNVDTVSGQIQDLRGEDLTGDMKMFLDVLIANANRVFYCWTLGTYPVATETKTLTFGDEDNCLSVLQMLCSEDNYNTEFEIVTDEWGGRTLNIGATGKVFTHAFEYGKNKGLYELTREKTSSSNIVTKLFAYGSSKNINTSNYRASKLCLPTKSKAGSFLLNAISIGKYGIWEKTVTFEDIFPHREGTVTVYDPMAELDFIDTGMNFDLNAKDGQGNTLYLIPGTPAKVHFNTGNLAGYEFEIASYNHATKLFTLKSYEDDRGLKLPNDSTVAFQIAEGNKYTLIDIYQPQSYIDTAETALAVKGGEYLAKYSQPNVQYGLTIDKVYLKDLIGGDVESNIIWVGDYIPIKDTDLDVDRSIRVKGFSRDLLDDYPAYTSLTISDLTVSVSLISRVITDLKGLDNIVKINNLNDPAKARRNYLAAQEVLNMVFDPEGDFYTEKIKPLSIDTTMLSVGAKSMQFGLVGTIFQPCYAGQKNRVVYTGGVLTHYAILDVNEDPRTWNITDGDVTLGSDAAYYVYAKCARVGTGATMYFSLTKIPADSDATYFHFLIGVINSVGTNNERALALMYGFTTINGRFIKTGRIQNAGGTTYFDLDAGEFRGSFKFTNGTDVEEVIGGVSIVANGALEAAQGAQDYIDNVLPSELSGLQAQIDGVVDSWFFGYSPTYSNYPASEWTTEEQRQRHVGDTFTNTQEYVNDETTPDAGKSWRLVWSDLLVNYIWTPIADSDAVKALLAASKAQDTADGKRRIFTAQPFTPYEEGDLWSQGPTGDLMKCITTRLTGAYNAADWGKASKYTDDTAVNNLVIGGRNLLLNSNKYQVVAAGNYASGITQTIENGVIKVIAAAGNGNWMSHFLTDVSLNADSLKNEDSICISFKIKSDNSNVCPTFYLKLGMGYFAMQGVVGTEYTTVYYVTPYLSTNALSINLGFGTAIGTYYIKEFKIEIGNKATDWTPAPEDVTALIAIAQTTADTANTSVESLNTYVDGAFKDGIITQSEAAAIETYKNQVTKDFNDLIAGYNVIYANAYLTGTAKTDLLNAKVTMSGAKDNLLASITTAIADGNTTVAEKADVDAKYTLWDSAFSAYKGKLELANKAIQINLDAIGKSYADAIQVGGRNLISDSKKTYTGSTDAYGGYNLDPLHALTMELTAGQLYTISWKQISGASPDYITLRNSSLQNIQSEEIANGGTFMCNVSGVVKLYFYCFAHVSSAFSFSHFKLEKGNKATDWTPAPEDSDYILKAMKDGSTDINGGLLATNVIFMKNLAGLISAGMSGSTTDNVAFWAGGTYQNAIDAIAKIILRMDGSGQLAGGKINWDAAGAMNVGLFTIFNNLLSSGNISFTSDALEDLADISGSASTATSPGAITANSGNGWSAAMQSSNFTLSKNSLVKFRLDQTLVPNGQTVYATCHVNIKDSNGTDVYVSNRSKSVNSSEINVYDYSVNLPAGTYYLYVIISMTHASGNYQIAEILGYGGSGTTISIQPVSALTKIANNGFYSYWGANAYLYLRTDYGFQVMFGNYGIQCTTAGLKNTSNGLTIPPTWASL